MFSDALWTFISPLGPVSLIGLASAQSNVLDFLGQGQGTVPQNIIGNTTLFGQPDAFGVGGYRMDLAIATGGSAFVGVGVSMNIQLQYAADLGTPTYLPDTWITVTESGAMAVGSLLANTIVWRNPFIPPQPLITRPRYARLNFVMTGGTFTTGSIAYAIPEIGRDDLTQKYASRNYAV